MGFGERIIQRVKDAAQTVEEIARPVNPEEAKKKIGRGTPGRYLQRTAQTGDDVARIVAENELQRRSEPPYEG